MATTAACLCRLARVRPLPAQAPAHPPARSPPHLQVQNAGPHLLRVNHAAAAVHRQRVAAQAAPASRSAAVGGVCVCSLSLLQLRELPAKSVVDRQAGARCCLLAILRLLAARPRRLLAQLGRDLHAADVVAGGGDAVVVAGLRHQHAVAGLQAMGEGWVGGRVVGEGQERSSLTAVAAERGATVQRALSSAPCFPEPPNRHHRTLRPLNASSPRTNSGSWPRLWRWIIAMLQGGVGCQGGVGWRVRVEGEGGLTWPAQLSRAGQASMRRAGS